MKRLSFLAINLLLIFEIGFSQGDEFAPNGKPILRIFSNFHTTFSDGESASQFELKRIYLGYEHHFTENLYVKANLDVGNPETGELEMAAYVKYAYLRYKAHNFNVQFGLIPTTQFKLQEDAWGYRYIEKSFQDLFKFNSSADLGVSVAYQFCKIFSADVIIANGEGYKKIEGDSSLRAGFGVTLTPLKNFTGRVYYDFSKHVNTQTSIATFLGYAHNRFSLGAEYMIQLNPGFEADRKLDGLSFFGTLHAAPKWKLFARYDNLSPNTPAGEMTYWTQSNDGQLFIAGFEFSPTNGIKLAPTYEGWSPEDNSESFISAIYLNCEINF